MFLLVISGNRKYRFPILFALKEVQVEPRGKNAMAGKMFSCPKLLAAYSASENKKSVFLETKHAKEFCLFRRICG
jgi:hypothetical protein